MAPEHLEALLKLVVDELGSKADSAFLPAVVQLLVAVAAAAPPLYADQGSQVCLRQCLNGIHTLLKLGQGFWFACHMKDIQRLPNTLMLI